MNSEATFSPAGPRSHVANPAALTPDWALGFDLQAVITALYVYPVKSCAGVRVDEAVLTETGLAMDRTWMVVNTAGDFVTQRELPRMALVQPTLLDDERVSLQAPGMPTLVLQGGPQRADAVAPAAVQVRIWDDTLLAHDEGAQAAEWFSQFLGQALRVVRFDPAQQRVCSPKWTGGATALTQFADGFSILVLSDASLEQFNTKLQSSGGQAVPMLRFRPNVVLGAAPGQAAWLAHDEDRVEGLYLGTGAGAVQLPLVKPCPRCPIPNIDLRTALSSPEVGDQLQTYRQDPRVDGAVTFGMNAIVAQGAGSVLRQGQAVGANYVFE